jgi:hypothetical protein
VRIMASVQLGYTGRYLVWSGSHNAMVELSQPTLDEATVQDLVAFLKALSSDRLLSLIAAENQGQERSGVH